MRGSGRRLRAAGLLWATVGALACAHGEAGFGVPLDAAAAQAARARLDARPPPPPSWAANGLLTAYGQGERLRLRVQLLLGTNHRFRLTAIGPHGAAVWVVASDGQQLTAVDLSKGEGHRAPATREGIASLGVGLDVGLPLADWLDLLACGLTIPADATASARPHGQISWSWVAPGAAEPTSALADDAGRIVAVRVPADAGRFVDASFLPAHAAATPVLAKEIDVRVADGNGRTLSSLSLSLEAPVLAPPAAGADPFVVSTP